MTVPTTQGLDLYEVYEASGALLVVTSALGDVPPLRPGDVVVRRSWSTAAPVVEVPMLRSKASYRYTDA